MTAVDLDALDAARAAATPGPWRLSDGNVYRSDEHSNEPVAVGPWNGSIDAADAALIVAAVNALPDLLAEARKYRALREAVEAERDEIDEQAGQYLNSDLRRGAYIACASRLRAVLAAVDGDDGA